MAETFSFFVGVDLGSESHRVVTLNAVGDVVGRRSFDHKGSEIHQLFAWLAKITNHTDSSLIAVAAETPRGSIVESALERGHPVFSINPKQVDRFRNRFSVAGAKDDDRDAFVEASALRTDQQCFRRLSLGDPRLVMLRELSRTEEILQRDLRRTCNQLWSLVQRYFPVLLSLCPAADEPWLWGLLQCAPLPTQAAKLTLRRLETLLGQYRIRRFSAEDLAALLRQPPLPMAPGSAEALAESALLLLPQLFLLQKQVTTLAKRLEKIIDQLQHDTTFSEHRDIEILRNFPGVGRGFIVKVLAEAFTPLVDRDYQAFRALSGVAPVTRQSGKSKLVSQRHSCNHRVQHAVFHSANIFVQKDPQAREQYHELRRKGKTHARALRGVADRMLSLIFVLLKNQCFYDPTRRNRVTVPEGAPPLKTP